MNNPTNQYSSQQIPYQQGQNPQQYQRVQMPMRMPMQGQQPQGPPQQGQRMQHYQNQQYAHQQQQQMQQPPQQMGSMQMRQRMPQQQVPQHAQHMPPQQSQQQHMGSVGQSPQMLPPQHFNVSKGEISPVTKNVKVPDDPVLMRALNSVREPDFEQMFMKR